MVDKFRIEEKFEKAIDNFDFAKGRLARMLLDNVGSDDISNDNRVRDIRDEVGYTASLLMQIYFELNKGVDQDNPDHVPAMHDMRNEIALRIKR